LITVSWSLTLLGRVGAAISCPPAGSPAARPGLRLPKVTRCRSRPRCFGTCGPAAAI